MVIKFAVADLMSKLSKSEAEFKQNLIHIIATSKNYKMF